ncbi:MAG: hypothetical protein ABH951_00630 [Patescibacteria group bacterium]
MDLIKDFSSHKKYLLPVLNIAMLCVIIFTISVFFIHKSNLIIGFILLALSGLCLASLSIFKIKIKNTEPDIIFGIIDNGILALFAILGGKIAGVTGAIIGGVVGNSITDGIAGMFEGYWAERLRGKNIKEERVVLGSAVGKMAGCLFGAGVVLIIASFLRF